jgi:large subunit ribosomal protein L19
MGPQQIMDRINAELTAPALPRFDIGDTIDVHCRIIEGDKERIQIFRGVFIGRKGRGVNESITVRRIVNDEGVERIFPVRSPSISKIEVVRRADTRRAKMYFLREREGRSRRLRDRRRGMKHVEGLPTAQP